LGIVIYVLCKLKKPSTKKPSRAHHEPQTAFFSLQPEAALLLPESSAPQNLTGCRLQIERPDGSRLTLILPTIDLASAKQNRGSRGGQTGSLPMAVRKCVYGTASGTVRGARSDLCIDHAVT
jgi:hypothetical protein